MEDLEFKIEDDGLWIKDILILIRRSKFEDMIIPHKRLLYLFLFIFCRESRYFEDIVQV